MPQKLENRTFEEICIGDEAEISRRVTSEDIRLFAAVSGDINPSHLDEKFAGEGFFKRIVAHGIWAGSLISAVLGTKLPGPGTIYVSQTFHFRKPVYVGDRVTAVVRVLEKNYEKQRVSLSCRCLNSDGDEILVGEAVVIPPSIKSLADVGPFPEIRLDGRKVLHEDNACLAEEFS